MAGKSKPYESLSDMDSSIDTLGAPARLGHEQTHQQISSDELAALARIKLGKRLRNRRKERSLTATEVAQSLHWTSQFYGQIENGTKSSDDIRAWVLLAEALQLNREQLIEQVWETRDGFTIRIPEPANSMRKQLVQIALELYASDIVKLP